MMKVSTKGRYGTRLMLDLALHYKQGNVFLGDIAKRQHISLRYLEQLMPPLKAAGLVYSNRGVKGGYSLAKAPQEITVLDIVEILEGSISPVNCVDRDNECARSKICITRDIWTELAVQISITLGSVSLEEMVHRHKNKQCSLDKQINYFI